MPIAANSPPNASPAAAPHAAELDVDGRPGSSRRRGARRCSPWTATESPPVSPLVISALIVADGVLVDPGDPALDASASSTSAESASGSHRGRPAGAERVDRVDASRHRAGSTRSTGSSASASWIGRDRASASGRANLGADLGRRHAGRDRLVRVDMTWTSGAASTRSLVTLSRPSTLVDGVVDGLAVADSTASDPRPLTTSAGRRRRRLRFLLDDRDP